MMFETRREPGSNESGIPGVIFYGPARVSEVYYDEKGRPWACSEARLLDKIWFVRDWLFTPVLHHSEDFTGEPEWLDDLQKMAEDEA